LKAAAAGAGTRTVHRQSRGARAGIQNILMMINFVNVIIIPRLHYDMFEKCSIAAA
jgi:hypothetical protein